MRYRCERGRGRGRERGVGIKICHHAMYRSCYTMMDLELLNTSQLGLHYNYKSTTIRSSSSKILPSSQTALMSPLEILNDFPACLIPPCCIFTTTDLPSIRSGSRSLGVATFAPFLMLETELLRVIELMHLEFLLHV